MPLKFISLVLTCIACCVPSSITAWNDSDTATYGHWTVWRSLWVNCDLRCWK